MSAVSKPSAKDAIRMHVLTAREEAVYFRAAARYPNLHDVGRIILNQGMRPDEVMGLRCEHVDIDAGEIQVVDGKSAAARRTLYMTPETRSILARRKGNRALGWLFEGRTHGTRLSKLNGSHDAVLDAINPCAACSRSEGAHRADGCAGFAEPDRPVRFVLYDLRHTFATRMSALIDLATLKDIMGHQDIRVTQKYVHPTRDRQRSAMEAYSASMVTQK